MEKIRRFNLDIALFNKELNAFIETVNEIDDETNNLLIETFIAVDRLQNSKFREISSSHQKNFALNLDDEIFECRRYIVCRLCHENIPLCSEDFESHIQKKSHKEREIGLKSTFRSVNSNGNDSALITCNTSINRRNNLSHEQSTQSNTNSPTEALASVSLNGTSRSISIDSSQSIPEKVCVTPNLENVIQSVDIFKAISTKIIEITCRTGDRMRREIEIVSFLTRHLKEFDSTLEIIPIGSSTYGFGGAVTDFNIHVNTSASNESVLKFVNNFEKLLRALEVPTAFEFVGTTNGDRTQRKQFVAIHRESKIQCVIQFHPNCEVAESSQVIRDAIVHTPLCFHLIAYVRCWQDELNEAAAEKGMRAFQFNTYIISVLVIFFLQVNKKIPKLEDLPASQSKCINTITNVDRVALKRAIGEFFEFYGKQYQSGHLISLHIGRWQVHQLLQQQTVFLPEQKRARDAILANASNWENCVMYVQDIKSPGTNIAAEISNEDANNFKVMCKLFSSDKISDGVDVEYLSKLVKFEPIVEAEYSASSLENVNSSMSPLQDALASLEKLKLGQPCSSNGSSDVSMCTSPRQSTSKSLKDFISAEDVSKRFRLEMDQIVSRSRKRVKNERQIINILSPFFKARSAEAIVPFGSVTFGFGGSRTNLNILVVPGIMGQAPGFLRTSFEHELKTSEMKQDFEFQGQVKANRVQMDRLKIVHRSSNIECLIEFRTESSLQHAEQTSKIIADYMILHPMCKPLIAYVRAWQIVLNDVATRNGLQMLQINSYIISVLVIFYLQICHGLPVVNKLPSMIANKSVFSSQHDFGHFVKEFFNFYGTMFQKKTHLISANIGKWQQINSPGQTKFTPEQKRMREGIMQCPENWRNCFMYVQDLVLPSINITAELTQHEVDMFVKMCQTFAEYEPIVSSSFSSAMSSASSQSSANSMVSNHCQDSNFIHLIEKEMAQARLPLFIDTRQNSETEIISVLKKYFDGFDPPLNVDRCGSASYGVRLLNSNFNFLIITKRPKDELDFFNFNIEKTDISKHFRKIGKISANRAVCRQISLIHIKSGIHCTLLFDKDDSIVKSAKIIEQFTKEPLCNDLIMFVRIWQDFFNQKGIAHFRFNTYTISVLVIFFLQMEFKASFPPIETLLTTTAKINSNISDFKTVLRQFFHFYGNRYQIWNHVISINIGQWQERRLQAQKNFSLAKKRLRDGIKASPENWTNCGMFVQDVVRPDINITAEISKKAAEQFQQMCKQFIEKTK